MSKMRPKALWWSWKTYAAGPRSKDARRLERKGQRRVRDREARREIDDQRG